MADLASAIRIDPKAAVERRQIEMIRDGTQPIVVERLRAPDAFGGDEARSKTRGGGVLRDPAEPLTKAAHEPLRVGAV
jgi:hypothetical protein